MESKIVKLKTPAAAEFARSVRMLAANLAVVCGLSIDDVEDVRMAAEEGFVYACATDQDFCDILFAIDEAQIQMTFSLGPQRDVEDAYEDGSFDYAQLILGSVTDEYSIDDDHTRLTVLKRMGGAE